MPYILKKNRRESIVVDVNNTDSDFNVLNSTQSHTAIQEAINLANSSLDSRDTVLIRGNHIINSRINPKSNVKVVFDVNSKLTCGAVAISDWMFLNLSIDGSDPIDNFHIQGGIFDLNNVFQASAIQLRDATNCSIKYSKFVNGATNSWFVKFGTQHTTAFPENTGIVDYLNYGKNNLVEFCNFKNHAGSLGMILAFNQKNFKCNNNYFSEKTNAGPIVEFWQQMKNCEFVGNHFENNDSSKAIYWSIDSENINILNNTFINTKNAIRGGLETDNGRNINGNIVTHANNINICNNHINHELLTGTENAAIAVGATKNFAIKGNKISNCDYAILLNNGGKTLLAGEIDAQFAPYNGIISENTFTNIKVSANGGIIKAPILFTCAGANVTGTIRNYKGYINITNNTVLDDRLPFTAPKSTERIVAFESSFTNFMNIKIKDNMWNYNSTITPSVIKNQATSTLDASVIIQDNII